MKIFLTLGLCLLPLMASAQLEIVPPEQPITVFAGRPSRINVMIRNVTDKSQETNIRTRQFQAASSIMTPLGEEQPWKKLNVLPRQTIVETMELALPEVKVPTRFQIQWIGIGKTELVGYPSTQLKRLQLLAGDDLPLGVFDPDNKLKPVLRQAEVKFVDFEYEARDCRLILVWWGARTLPESVLKRVKTGLSVVWIRPEKSPAAFVLRHEAGVVVIVPQSGMTKLAETPLPQLNLIRYAELALQPDLIQLPEDRKEME